MLLGGMLLAEEEVVVTKRMEERLPQLVKLKLERKIYEEDDGFLAIVAKKELTTAEAQILDAENQDRRLLYRMIGSRVQPPLTADQVGQLRSRIWPSDATPSSQDPQDLFSMHGSNTIGAKLGPALVAAWLKEQGATNLVRIPGETTVECYLQGNLEDGTLARVEVQGHGSGTAYPALARDEAQVGMSSRPIKDKEVDLLDEKGAMRSINCEHVIALDALPILVHKKNPVEALTIAQVRDIFTGRINNWAEVGGKPGPINRYSRDEKSGTRDTFDSLVMNKEALAPGTREFEDSNALSDSVAEDPNGIGYVGIAYIRNAKALKIAASADLTPLYPTRASVATEQYPVSRRLFLYAPKSRSQDVSNFLEFVISDKGQFAVENAGFIPLSIAASNEPPERTVTGISEFDEITAKAKRLPVVFRFRPDGFELDNKSQADLVRLANYINSDPDRRKRDIVLVGFSEKADGPAAQERNVILSKERARAVGDLLKEKGLVPKIVTGVGGVLPVGSNESEVGRQMNQRVEVYLLDGML